MRSHMKRSYFLPFMAIFLVLCFTTVASSLLTMVVVVLNESKGTSRFTPIVARQILNTQFSASD